MTKAKSTSAPNAAPESVAEKRPPVSAEERYRMIAEAAYFRAEKRGFVGGNVAEDWLQAEAAIDRMLREQGRLPLLPPEVIEQRVQGALSTDPAAIAAQVRAITLDALTRGHLDTDALKRVTAAVVKGAREGAAPLGEHGGQALKEAMRGLDEALAGTAEAAQLAIQEAAGRAGEFSKDALTRAADDLATLQTLFIETLQDAARSARGTVQTTFTELSAHTRSSGSAVGQRSRIALEQLAQADTQARANRSRKGPKSRAMKPRCSPVWPPAYSRGLPLVWPRKAPARTCDARRAVGFAVQRSWREPRTKFTIAPRPGPTCGADGPCSITARRKVMKMKRWLILSALATLVTGAAAQAADEPAEKTAEGAKASMPKAEQSAKTAAEEAKDATRKAVEAAKLAVEKADQAVTEASQKAAEAASQAARDAEEAAKLAARKTAEASKKATAATKEAAHKAEEAAQKAAVAAKESAQKAEDAVKKAAASGKEAAQKAAVATRDAAQKAWEATKEAADKALEATKETARNVKDAVTK